MLPANDIDNASVPIMNHWCHCTYTLAPALIPAPTL